MATPEPQIHYAPAVTSGPFSFHPSTGLQVTLPDPPSQSFSRASSRDLYKLLTYTPPVGPELTKTGKVKAVQPGLVKDQTAAFYQAQLIHYGLKPLKTKEAAKKALLKAFEGAEGTNLKVPKEVAKEEKDLKAKYLVANVVAKKESEANDKKFGKAGSAGPVKKEESKPAIAGKPAAKEKVVKEKSVKSVVPKQEAPKREPSWQGQSSQQSQSGPYRSSQTGVYFKGSISGAGVIMCECDEPAIFLETKKAGPNTGRCFFKCDQKAKCGTFLWEDDAERALSNLGLETSFPSAVNQNSGSSQSQSQQQAPLSSSPPPPTPPPAPASRPKQTARKRGGLSPTWRGSAVGSSSGIGIKRGNDESWASGSGSGGGGGKKAKSSSTSDVASFADNYTFDDHQLGNGMFYVDTEDFSLSLAYSTSYNHLWGVFDFGVVTGYLRSNGPLPPMSASGKGRTIDFNWRGHEREESSHFSSDQVIPITFVDYDDGSWEISGEIIFMGRQEFRGFGHEERSDSLPSRKAKVQTWKREYYKLTRANYEREADERWGKSTWGKNYGDSRREVNSDSD